MLISLAIKIGIIIVIGIIITVGTYTLLYKYTGWKDFSMKANENFLLKDADYTIIEKLRFRDCIFTVTNKDGQSLSYDVSYVLNLIAQSYTGNAKKGATFKLSDPGLSIFSFNIDGFCDNKVKPDPLIWTGVTLVGSYKKI